MTSNLIDSRVQLGLVFKGGGGEIFLPKTFLHDIMIYDKQSIDVIIFQFLLASSSHLKGY